MAPRNKKLKVAYPSGARLFATIIPAGQNVVVRVPDFDIEYQVERPKYQASIKLLEKYLEDVILRGMAEDEDFDPSSGADFKPGGNEKKSPARKAKRDRGDGDSAGVHAGARGDEPPESFGGGLADLEMAASGNTQAGGEDQGRN